MNNQLFNQKKELYEKVVKDLGLELEVTNEMVEMMFFDEEGNEISGMTEQAVKEELIFGLDE